MDMLPMRMRKVWTDTRLSPPQLEASKVFLQTGIIMWSLAARVLPGRACPDSRGGAAALAARLQFGRGKMNMCRLLDMSNVCHLRPLSGVTSSSPLGV